MKKILLPLVFLGGACVGYFTDSFVKYSQNATELKKVSGFDLDKYNSGTLYEITIEKIEDLNNEEDWTVERRFKINSIDIDNLSAIAIDDLGQTKRITIKAPETDKVIAQYLLKQNL